jgi:hypothetical protein
LDPAAMKMIALIPAPNLATFPSNYAATGSYEFNRDNFDIKINYNPTDKSSVFGRYSLSPSEDLRSPVAGPAGGDALAGGQPGRAPGESSRPRSAAPIPSPRGCSRTQPSASRGSAWARKTSTSARTTGWTSCRSPARTERFLQSGYPRFAISNFSSIGNPNVSNPFLFRDNQYVS